MIKNSLKYIKNYLNLSDKIRCGLEYLMQNNLKLLENGRYDISGDDIYVNIQDYNTKPKENGLWEAHRKYIDIQYIIEGSEYIGTGEIENFVTEETYNAERDVEFLKTDKPQDFIRMDEGDFMILYPQDVHMPQISFENPVYVKKAVIKISV